MQKVSFGPASWIGLIGAAAAALAPLFGSLPVTWGATVAAILAAVVIIGRQAQAMVQTMYHEQVPDELLLHDELPAEPTDVPVNP